MKQISKLVLNNFQQWKSGEIKFTSGLNILIGDTESGKSTLFRAIYSILTGKMPEDYIRKGTKGCEVKIEFTDGTIFRRLRNKKDNIADANGLIFERVGKEIPFEYFNRLGKTGITFGNKDLSLCSYSQFEPHFFITLSDYDKSKLIGTICGIDLVDKLMDLINKDIRSNNSNIKFLEQQISEQKSEKSIKIKEFEEVDRKMNLLMECSNDINSKFKLIEKLSELKTNLDLLNSNIHTLKSNKSILDLRISEFDKNNVEELNKFYNLKENLEILSSKLEENKKIQDNLILEGLDSNKVNLLDDLIFLKEKLVNYNKEIESQINLKQEIDKSLTDLFIKKEELLKGYDKCPLCGGIL